MAKLIKSLLDNDFYKISMMNAVFQKYPGADATYSFITRSKRSVPEGQEDEFIGKVKDEIERLGDLRFTDNEISYLHGLDIFPINFLEYLRNFSLSPKNVSTLFFEESSANELVDIKVEGNWLQTILFEVPILSIVSELWSKQYGDKVYIGAKAKLANKIKLIKELDDNRFKLIDFGTRRRHSWMWQDDVIKTLINNLPKNFVGTSNVYLSMRLGTKPIGTMAHEWLQAHQVLAPIYKFQRAALETWSDVYRGKLGIALTDTINMDAFLNEFDLYNAKLYDGCRQDSGDPIVWTEKLLIHYKRFGINPLTKTAVYSDGLDIPSAIKIFDKYKDKINISFGIGTNLTNDMGDETYKPLSIVLKMDSLNGFPVAKISDTPEKAVSKNSVYLRYLKTTYNINE